MNNFTHNMEILDKMSLNPQFAKEQARYDIILKKNDDKSNYLIMKQDVECYIHSTYNQAQEVKMAFKNEDYNAEIVILFGYGRGQYLEHILRYYKNLHKVIVIEPTNQIILEALEDSSFKFLEKRTKDVVFLINFEIEDCFWLIRRILNEKIIFSIIHNISYCSVFHEDYNKLLEYLSKHIMNKKINIKTAVASSNIWLINSLWNVMKRSVPVGAITEIFKDKTVVIVGAGPSLNKNMHLIEKLKERAIVIAVGSAINILERNGIKPHIRMAYDGTEAEMKIIKDVNTEDIPLIHTSKLYYSILPLYKGPTFCMITDTEYLWRHFYKISDYPNMMAGTGSTITTVALNLVCNSGIAKVILLGQDLSFKDGEKYANGGENTLFMRSDLIKMLDIMGEEVYASEGHLAMKASISGVVAKRRNVRFINASEGGIGIDGAENMSLQKVLDDELQLENQSNVDIYAELKSLIENPDNNNQRDLHFKNNLIGISAVKKEIFQIDEINNDRIHALAELNKKFEAGGVKSEDIVKKSEEMLEKELMLHKNMFYYMVVAKELKGSLDMFRIKYDYAGNDFNKKVETYLNIMNGVCNEITRFLLVAKDLIKKLENDVGIDFDKTWDEFAISKFGVLNEEKKEILRFDDEKFHVGIMRVIIKILLLKDKLPKKVIIPIDIKTFSPAFDLSPSYSRWQDMYLSKLIFECEYKKPVELYDTCAEISEEKFNSKEVNYPLSEYSKIKDFEESITKGNVRDKFIYYYLWKIDASNRKRKLMKDLVDECINNGVEVFAYLMPINYEAAKELVGEEFIKQFDSNRKFFADSFGRYKSKLVNYKDLSVALGKNYFETKDSDIEKFNDEGMMWLKKQNESY